MVDGFINFNLNEKTPTIIKVIGTLFSDEE